MLIQILLVVGVAVLALLFLRNRNAMRFRAGKKLLLLLFSLAFVASVAFPEMLTAVANLVGVGRGTDLLLYALVVAFLFVALNTYLKFRDIEARQARLARYVALLEARSARQDQDAAGSAGSHEPPAERL